MNRYPLWKYLTLVVVLLLGAIYALPNFYGEFAIQILTGGTLRNAIPREASVKLAFSSDRRDELVAALQSAFDVVRNEIMRAEPNVMCQVADADHVGAALTMKIPPRQSVC